MARSSNFSDRQKAELYCLHKATCAFSGTNLWLLDYGADPYYQIDWADHVLPVSKGGLSTLDNGVCAGWFYNYTKAAKTEESKYLFRNGSVTEHFAALPEVSRSLINQQIDSFHSLDYSDWYFNRSLWRAMLGAQWLAFPNSKYKRDVEYYSKAAWKTIVSWRRITAKEQTARLEDRDLVPDKMYADQEIMLRTQDARNVSDIRGLAADLMPFYSANFHTLTRLEQVGLKDKDGVVSLWSDIESNAFVTPRIKNYVRAKLESGTIGV